MKAIIVNSIRTADEMCKRIRYEFDKYKFLSVKIDHQKRSIISNGLQFHWYGELEQQGDQTTNEYRRYCKYHFGLALRAANDDFFAEKMGDILRRYSYEERLEMMDFIDVTSTFNRSTMTKYLHQIKLHYTPLGFVLTSSEDL